MILYGIKSCDTVRKARRWLETRGLEYHFHDLRSDGLTPERVTCWLQLVPAEQLLNKRSTTWKNLAPEQREAVSGETLPRLLARHPTLVKRPVLEAGDRVMVGFSADRFADFFASQESVS